MGGIVNLFSVKETSSVSGLEHKELVYRKKLVLMQRKARRRKVWFRVLNRVERGIVNLTIRCVDRVRSSKLAAMLRNIVGRLEEALRSRVDRFMVKIGQPLARKIACLAVSWGNRDALNWVVDTRFARYLTVVHMNDS